ncbi:unnamed protein product [Phytophthora lilii]|uniref:Unnamed protein product n=1 Tax=Phytophthora lilii TaxID=2077276 RepID=A0A9W6U422_9STRA|nr:unnamed protein product [Phytophthora lilii]
MQRFTTKAAQPFSFFNLLPSRQPSQDTNNGTQAPPTFSASSTMHFSIAIFFLLTVCGTAADKACPSTEVVKFAELYANPHLHPCQNASAGFSMAPPTGYPTEPQVKAMCASDACRALIKDVLALKPADCFLSFAGVKLNAYKLASDFDGTCKADTGKDHEDGKYYPTPKPTDDKYHPTPKPKESNEHYPTPTPTGVKHYSTPTPKPTDGKYYYPTSKPTEDNKHYPTPTPTDDKYSMGSAFHHQEEPKIVKNGSSDKPCPTHYAGKESMKMPDAQKPPMNSTAAELFPMPNTTYKAGDPKTTLKA